MLLRRKFITFSKLITFMLPCFFAACQSTEEEKDDIPFPPLMTSTEYVYIPIKDVQFSYFDKRKWRILTQRVEYIDTSVKESLSSLWFYQLFPLEIIVLDNPDLNQPFSNNLNDLGNIGIRRTKQYLPFKELISSNHLDAQMPLCHWNEFRAVARIVSAQKYIGIPSEEVKRKEDDEVHFRNWYSLGEILCISLQREMNE